MKTHRFFVEKLRFHLTEEDVLVFVGWFYDGLVKDRRLRAYLDKEELPIKIKVNRGAEVRQKYLDSVNEIREEVVAAVKLPDDWKEGHAFRIIASSEEKTCKAYRVSVRKLSKIEHRLEYYIESCHRDEEKVSVSGWCMGSGEVKFCLLDGKEQLLAAHTERYYRRDLLPVFPECEKSAKPGFLVQTTAKGINTRGRYYLEMRSAERHAKTRLKKWDDGGKVQYAMEKAEAALRYLERNGVRAALHKIKMKLSRREEADYGKWREKYEVTAAELEEQRKTAFSYRPKFSIVVPVYRTEMKYLREMIDSVRSQTYDHWQLCLAGLLEAKEAALAEEYAAGDRRIVLGSLDSNGGISENTNAAMALSDGDVIVFAGHDDVIPANALYEMAKALNEDGTIEVFYSDEDKISRNGKTYFEPHFKPDFNIDLLCSMNYICHLFAVRKEIAVLAGGFDSRYDGAQDLDYILRCCELAEKIYHIPKILYHWRCHDHSAAANPEGRWYAFEAGRAAVEAHYKRCNIPASVGNAESYGRYRTIYEWEENPLVSILIPNKDHSRDLDKCLRSILEKSDYQNYEIIVAENNSTEQATFDYYAKIQEAYSQVRVIRYEGAFNFSKINNFAAKEARGDYFLLLNNDTECIRGSVIREMLGCCMREDVGIVGAKLLYEDDTIQHAGVVLGFGGTAGHAFVGKPRYDTGYFGRISCVQDYSAVAAACMMVKRSVYEQAGGLSEELAVAFNDVDFCLRVRELGKLVVYNPYAELYHYGSKSKGHEDSPEKAGRFQNEADIFVRRWRSLIERGDPYYNKNLTLDRSDFSIRG